MSSHSCTLIKIKHVTSEMHLLNIRCNQNFSGIFTITLTLEDSVALTCNPETSFTLTTDLFVWKNTTVMLNICRIFHLISTSGQVVHKQKTIRDMLNVPRSILRILSGLGIRKTVF